MARAFGAMLFYGAANINFPTAQQGTGAAQFAWTRNALGNISVNGPGTAAAGTLNAWASIADYKRPNITFPAFPGQGSTAAGVLPTSNEYNEAFGTAAGGPGNPYSAGVQSFFGTPAFPAGMAIVDIFAIYSVVTTALTSATLGLTRTSFVNNSALTVTTMIAAAATPLPTSAGASSPYVSTLTLAQPLQYESINFSDLTVEFTAVTGATANSLQLFGLGCHVVAAFS